MLDRLDSETRAFHAEIDAYWLDLLTIDVTLEQYKRHLMRVYGFEAPLESALAYTPNLDRRERGRPGLLAQDLLSLGITPSKITALPQCDIAPFDDPAEALGWKYVAARPTQFHTAIKLNVDMRIREVANATTYLCDGMAAARWQQLGAMLDQIAARDFAKQQRMCEGARAAFACMGTWFRRSAPQLGVAQ